MIKESSPNKITGFYKGFIMTFAANYMTSIVFLVILSRTTNYAFKKKN